MDQSEYREQIKLYVEYLRHLTTLSTGSIVLIVTFLERLFSKPLWKVAVVISLVGFMVSVLASIVVYTVTIWFPSENFRKSNRLAGIHGLGIIFTWAGFLIGILCLGIFALRNLMQSL